MDKASDYESGDSRFEFWGGLYILCLGVILKFFFLVYQDKLTVVISFVDSVYLVPWPNV